MKIVHVLPHLGRGGAERLTIELANRQVEAGHDVTLLAGYPLPESRMHGGVDPRVEVRFILPDAGSRLAKYPKLLPWLRRHRGWIAGTDILHCHLTFGAVFASLVCRTMRRQERPALVETYHAVGMPIPRAQRWLHARFMSQWDAAAFMVEDPYWRRFCERHRDIACRIIPVGVDAPDVSALSPEDRAEYRRSVGIPADASPIVGTVGRLFEERRPRRYVPIFARIAEAIGDRVHFLMGGDGPERTAILADAAETGIADRLHLPGLVERMEQPLSIIDLYITANVGSVPGVAGLQAIAAGVPVIALQLGDERGDPDSDWIWSSRDGGKVAKRAIELLRDSKKRAGLAERQKAHLVANHSPAAMASAYDSLYRELTAGRQIAPSRGLPALKSDVPGSPRPGRRPEHRQRRCFHRRR